ncbi:secretogranin-2b-like [Syngnathus typhle]|uniref:secretogranin-2b-like n=1 Tax=Syngnathus typhle TaxID=161592 RepID=UPI002A69E66D|nr:secretogranin-2b-like [Syngnathus typhle]
MLHFHHKLPAGAALVLLAVLLHGCGVQAASLPRHYQGQPAGSDLLKALQYIENLKQRNGGRPGPAPSDYDQVEKFKVLLQLASQQQQRQGDEEEEGGDDDDDDEAAPAERQDVSAEHLMRSLLESLRDKAKLSPASTPRDDRRLHRHRTKGTETAQSPPADYANHPRPHKKYPLMFEDEENTDASKRATEDLDQKYTPQSLANLRSIFEELERMPLSVGQKRDIFEDDEADEDGAPPGEEWVPVEEREESEEMVNGSHEEADGALGDQEDNGEEVQRRSDQDHQEDADDDTKLVDYYLLKVLEMSDQTQKRDQTGERRKRLIRPSVVDPRTVKELLELSLKLHVPPQDLIDTLLTEELRNLRRNPPPPPSSRYTTGQTPKIRYFNRRLPLKSKTATPEDMDREDFLDIVGVETISNEYPVMPGPVETTADRIPAGTHPDPNAVKMPPPPAGRRENLFLSELNKMPFRRRADDDDRVEDEVTTYLAAKVLTEYPPDGMAKRDTRAQTQGRFPYELYERAVKDYLSQAADSASRPMAKREAREEKPAEVQSKEAAEEEEEEGMKAKNSALAPGMASGGEGGGGGGGGGGEEHRDKAAAGM